MLGLSGMQILCVCDEPKPQMIAKAVTGGLNSNRGREGGGGWGGGGASYETGCRYCVVLLHTVVRFWIAGVATLVIPECNALVLDHRFHVLLDHYPVGPGACSWRLGARLCLYNVHLVWLRGRHVGFCCCVYSDVKVVEVCIAPRPTIFAATLCHST